MGNFYGIYIKKNVYLRFFGARGPNVLVTGANEKKVPEKKCPVHQIEKNTWLTIFSSFSVHYFQNESKTMSSISRSYADACRQPRDCTIWIQGSSLIPLPGGREQVLYHGRLHLRDQGRLYSLPGNWNTAEQGAYSDQVICFFPGFLCFLSVILLSCILSSWLPSRFRDSTPLSSGLVTCVTR